MTGNELANLYETWQTPTGMRAIRVAMGLSQERFGAVLEVSQRTVSHWERGSRTPTIRALVRVRRLMREQEAA